MAENKSLCMVAAVTQQRIIGNEGRLPWPALKSDMERFRRISVAAGDVIMGSLTFRSILERNRAPLAERRNIVLTRQNTEYFTSRGALTAGSVEEAVELACPGAAVIGGAEIYQQFLPLVEILHLTMVHANLPGDARFPAVIPDDWENGNAVVYPRFMSKDDRYRTSFMTYYRKDRPR